MAILEADIEKAFCEWWENDHSTKKILGTQIPVITGRVDIIAFHAGWLVIEAKRGAAGNHALAQVMSYVSAIKYELDQDGPFWQLAGPNRLAGKAPTPCLLSESLKGRAVKAHQVGLIRWFRYRINFLGRLEFEEAEPSIPTSMSRHPVIERMYRQHFRQYVYEASGWLGDNFIDEVGGHRDMSHGYEDPLTAPKMIISLDDFDKGVQR